MSHRFSIAPMMDRTDRHCRYFHRLLTGKSLLYTEMLHSNAIIKGNTNKLLSYSHEEHPLAIQLGGSDPESLAEASVISEEFGYKEINLNVGCPSSKVQKGRFGAILMKEPELVAKCISNMKKSVNIPVTVKCRIGVDDMDQDAQLDRFIEQVSFEGCNTFIIHARKAWLKGLSPKDNREIPPLNYERVYKLKDKFHHLNIVINGGIKTVEESLEHLNHVDGVMVGREAYDNPLMLNSIDKEIYKETEDSLTRTEILIKLLPYIQSEVNKGTKITHITRHIMGLFKGFHGAKDIRKYLVSLNNAVNPVDNFKFFLKETTI
ncbi:tRNA dihydrouridine(20/20a) synthase DusA [Gammaproteobacteria bacterium]|nr:tRNA dihydrouridine(20/20a) synthase DusA [Gammaproteobacteria bacterium]MDC0509015.1 tRNA dihydrouridine(20/20a) synthase DusA [Gammaproteobacteria bacterium]MDC0576947.1 tRNA dihydrouridine(20/20a) synthase DusA [Gammaproteobacteria bacterium]MDC3323536.1 tRNA dihydrouridine(20/20a) synthase DusA [Gammaproteobacteria bacterium]